MGFLDDMKRLFWVKKAVAKSAADKAAEKAKESGEDFMDAASETWKKGVDKAEEIGEKIADKARDTYQDMKERFSDKENDWTPRQAATPPPPKPAQETEAFKTGEKIGESAAKTWDKAKEEGKEVLDKAVKTSDKVWEKAEEVSQDVFEKAKNLAEKGKQKFDEGVDAMLDKAKKLDETIEEERRKIDPDGDGWADKPVNEKLREHEDLLKGKDDFFERASRYADGDYSMGKPIITKSGDSGSIEGMTPLPPLPEEDDEAIIDDGDSPEKP